MPVKGPYSPAAAQSVVSWREVGVQTCPYLSPVPLARGSVHCLCSPTTGTLVVICIIILGKTKLGP